MVKRKCLNMMRSNHCSNVQFLLFSLEALKVLDQRKNIYPEWSEPFLEKPKSEIKINFQIKPKVKKKIEIINPDNIFHEIVQKEKEPEK
jgi:hypothetical protein